MHARPPGPLLAQSVRIDGRRIGHRQGEALPIGLIVPAVPIPEAVDDPPGRIL